MQSNLSKYKKELTRLVGKGEILYGSLLKELGLGGEKMQEQLDGMKLPSFQAEYETWYSEALQVVKQILPDRLDDFVKLYKNDKRKTIDHLTYTLSDYMIGLRATQHHKVIADGKTAVPKFMQQKNILKSAEQRFESSLFDIRQLVQADILDDELDAARELLKQGFLRAAGAVAGVVLEKHLSEVCGNHSLKSRKKNPSIADFNDLLKREDIIDVPTWRFIQRLGDLRNLCDHNKDREPTKDEVAELVAGVEKVAKTLF